VSSYITLCGQCYSEEKIVVTESCCCCEIRDPRYTCFCYFGWIILAVIVWQQPAARTSCGPTGSTPDCMHVLSCGTDIIFDESAVSSDVLLSCRHVKISPHCWCMSLRLKRIPTTCPSSRKHRTRLLSVRWPTSSTQLIASSCRSPSFKWAHSLNGTCMHKAGFSAHFLLDIYAQWLA